MTNGNMITKLKGRDKERTKFLSTLNWENCRSYCSKYVLSIYICTYRWIVGPKMEDAFGGIFILSTEKCPWNIAFGFGRLGKNMKLCSAYQLWIRIYGSSCFLFFILEQTMYYRNKLVPNTWVERGNGWSIDNDVEISCYNATILPKFHCSCNR